nr:PH domain-containing protein [Agromyces seonyuensis]
MHTFRVTADAVEVRSGILFRTHRSARLDRIQTVNLSRPFFARLFGTAKLEVAVAGQDGNVQLAYLGSDAAEALRRDVLRLAAGIRSRSAGPAEGTASAPGTPQSVRDRLAHRVDDFLAPELDPDLAPAESVVHLPIGRVIASTVLSSATVMLLIFVGVVIWGAVAGTPWVLVSFLPAVIGLLGYYWTRISKSLRYSIAPTAHGVRVGHGLLSTGSQTLPPGRIHAVQVSQPLLWRIFGWYLVQIDIAGQSARAGEALQQTTVLPVGTLADARRVVALLLPDGASALDPFVAPGTTGRAGGDGFSVSPRSARWVRPFSWRRTGWALADDAVLLRRGALTRRLVIVPLARMQSVAIRRGPVRRALGLASLHVHTVTGPVTALLPVIGEVDGSALYERLSADAVGAASRDRASDEEERA